MLEIGGRDVVSAGAFGSIVCDAETNVIKSVRSIGLNLNAHDTYIKRQGMPLGVHELADHEFVVSLDLDRRLPFQSWVVEHIRPSQIAVSSTDARVIFEAVESGLGLGFLSDVDVAGRADLHPVLPPNKDWSVPLWLVTHVDLHRTGKVQAMLRCIETELLV